MAAKEKGLSSDPVMAEIGGSKGYTEQELEEVRSPILQDRGDHQRQQSYQNPYDIRSVPLCPSPLLTWQYIAGVRVVLIRPDISPETACHSTKSRDPPCDLPNKIWATDTATVCPITLSRPLPSPFSQLPVLLAIRI